MINLSISQPPSYQAPRFRRTWLLLADMKERLSGATGASQVDETEMLDAFILTWLVPALVEFYLPLPRVLTVSGSLGSLLPTLLKAQILII